MEASVINIQDKTTYRITRDNEQIILNDSLGYAYSIKDQSAETIYWQCDYHGDETPCAATVIQTGDVYCRGNKTHNHPGQIPGSASTDDVDEMSSDKLRNEIRIEETKKDGCATVLGPDDVIVLSKCQETECGCGQVHCPFCDVKYFKPAGQSRTRDHLELTHFAHAVQYKDLLIVKCFRACRVNYSPHYHCPVCPQLIMKRNSFAHHLLSHIKKMGEDNSVLGMTHTRHPDTIKMLGYSIDVCCGCPVLAEKHYHCPLCKIVKEERSVFINHVWRCGDINLQQDVISTDETVTENAKQAFILHPHVSVVRHVQDLRVEKCCEKECCEGKYHCPLCTTDKVKPSRHQQMRNHVSSHWKSRVPSKGYFSLVCYLPCEKTKDSDNKKKIRYHFHCPACGQTRRRRQAFREHVLYCQGNEIPYSDHMEDILSTAISEQPESTQENTDLLNHGSENLEGDFHNDNVDKMNSSFGCSGTDNGKSSIEELPKPTDERNLCVKFEVDRHEKYSVSPCYISEDQSKKTLIETMKTEAEENSMMEDCSLNGDIDDTETVTLSHNALHDIPGNTNVVANGRQDNISSVVSVNDNSETEESLNMEDNLDDTGSLIDKGKHGETDTEDLFSTSSATISGKALQSLKSEKVVRSVVSHIAKETATSWTRSSDKVEGFESYTLTGRLEDLVSAKQKLEKIVCSIKHFEGDPQRFIKLNTMIELIDEPEEVSLTDTSRETKKKQGSGRPRKIQPQQSEVRQGTAEKCGKGEKGENSVPEKNRKANNSDNGKVLKCDNDNQNTSDLLEMMQKKRGRGRPRKSVKVESSQEQTSPETSPVTVKEGCILDTNSKHEISNKKRKNSTEKLSAKQNHHTVLETPQRRTRGIKMDFSLLHSGKRKTKDLENEGSSPKKTGKREKNPDIANKTQEKNNVPELLHTSVQSCTKEKIHESHPAEVENDEKVMRNLLGRSNQVTQTMYDVPDVESTGGKAMSEDMPSNMSSSGGDADKLCRENASGLDKKLLKKDGKFDDLTSGKKTSVVGKSGVRNIASIPVIVMDSDLFKPKSQGKGLTGEFDMEQWVSGVTESEFTHHDTGGTENVQLKCSQCDFVGVSVQDIAAHLKTLHGVCVKLGRDCSVRTQSQSKHDQVEDKDGKYGCNICSKTYYSESRLKWHLTTVHHKPVRQKPNKGPKYSCNLCEFVCNSLEAVFSHKKLKHGEEIQCKLCNKRFTRGLYLQSHIETVHSTLNSIDCNICGRTFSNERYLKAHLKLHTGVKNFECKVCGKKFNAAYNLKIHMNTHLPTGEKVVRYVCSYCGKGFDSKAVMTDHLNKHTGEKPYACELCGKKFGFRSLLIKHKIFKHQTERPFKCTYCQKSFKFSRLLKNHLTTHTGQSEFVCSKCSKPFSTRSTLKTHQPKCMGKPWKSQTPTQQQIRQVFTGPMTNTFIVLTEQQVGSTVSLEQLKLNGQVITATEAADQQAILDIVVKSEGQEDTPLTSEMLSEMLTKSEDQSVETPLGDAEQGENTLPLQDPIQLDSLPLDGSGLPADPPEGPGEVYVCSECNSMFSNFEEAEVHVLSLHTQIQPSAADVRVDGLQM